MVNWTYWMENLIQQGMLGYTQVLGFIVWPIIFTAIIGYVYLKNMSVTAAAVIILIIFAAFGNLLVGVSTWYTLMYIVVSLIVAMLALVFLTKNRGG
jgi:hypothetical protein